MSYNSSTRDITCLYPKALLRGATHCFHSNSVALNKASDNNQASFKAFSLESKSMVSESSKVVVISPLLENI